MFMKCIEHLGKHSKIRNSAYRIPSTAFSNSSSSTTIADIKSVQYISIFGICGDVWHFSQQSYSGTINSHKGQLTLQCGSMFYWRENVFTSCCLALDIFPGPAISAFSHYIKIYLLIYSIIHHSILQPSRVQREAHITWICGGVPRT